MGNEMRVGVLAPLSRPGWVEAGRQLVAGAELAARERSVELVVRDTAADPARAVAAVDELVGLGVDALVGEYHSVVARAVAERAAALGEPYLCSSAVLDELVTEPTDWVARIAPVQSRGWRIFAEYLLSVGHERVAVAAQTSVYWAAGVGVLRKYLDVVELTSVEPAVVCDELAACGATALVLLVGTPEPGVPIVEAVRRDARLAEVLIGAPAGQPEFAEWAGLFGIPFLRYLPDELTPLGAQVKAQLGGEPSFVAFEGYDAIAVLAEVLRIHGAKWQKVAVQGTRGEITFSRVPGIGVWQWAWSPIQVVERTPAGFHTLHQA
ncbi:ABC transporter substrate-binding protein [Kribbella sp. NBC_01505]|uniref:ABC transporter substrate-binding protein n=1 Tax=Kribbella sp. NBC_01505 TaxID=2903580 RepID=UPI00386B8C51